MRLFKNNPIPKPADMNIGLVWINPHHYQMEKVANDTLYRLRAQAHKKRNLEGKSLVEQFDEHFGL